MAGVVCYYSSWAVYRVGAGKFVVGDVDPTLCTHIVYSFIGLQASGEVNLLDPWNDVGDASHQGLSSTFTLWFSWLGLRLSCVWS